MGKFEQTGTRAIETEEKSNEITAIPTLLDLLEINGCIVTIDAMGCQKDIAAKIIERCVDYILGLKGNQPSLYDDVKLYFADVLKNWKLYKEVHVTKGMVK